jgi:DNA ligase (NAD+)
VQPVFTSHAEGPLHGKSFVITGTLSEMDRDAAADRIRELGGTFQSSVGKTTSYLVLGANPGESKVVKADKLGTAKLSEQELIKMLKG